ncbi:MAG TPA: MFS transporter [Nitrososphaeraceae archaeon]
MIPIINRYNTGPILSLLLARVFYSANWFNIASSFYFIALYFKEDISMLGLITASFFVGVGLFQVPAGILAAKYGPKKIAISGILIASSAAILTGLSGSLLHIAALRFIVGVGMACFFGPSVILISKYLGRRSEGLGIGLINSAHAIGGILGVFVWVLLTGFVGWRISIIMGGILGLVTGLLLVVALSSHKYNKQTRPKGVKEEEEEEEKVGGGGEGGIENDHDDDDYDSTILAQGQTDFRIKLLDVRRTLFNKSLIILGLTLLSFQAGSSIILTFIVFYLTGYLKIDPAIAGFIGSLNLIIALLFSPIFGRIYDGNTRQAKKILLISGLASAIGVFGLAIPSLYIIIISMIISAIFLSAGFVIVYAEAKRINSLQQHPEYQTLAVSFVNGISLFGAFWIPLLFSFTVNQFGYTFAWILGGFIVILLILSILKLKK